MARIINSPGVQITEKDLSLRAELPVGTTVVVPGFASQGPVSEPLYITTMSELEAIYGFPTTPAEKYFYYSCKEVLNSPAILTTVRLPYGANTGSAFSNSYSGLFYPMLSSSSTPSVSAEWSIGAPIHKTLTLDQYEKLIKGDFSWNDTRVTGTSAADVTLSTTIGVKAGFFVLNDLQTVINEISEGYYIGFADNTATSTASPDFNSIVAITSLSSTTGHVQINPNRLDFALSATALNSARGVTSVSESLEKVGFIGFESQNYQDHISLGVFKVRRSTSDPSFLSLATSEKYLGSFDYNRKEVSPNGGILSNSFLEDTVNKQSSTVKLFVNPIISQAFNWSYNSNIPTSRVTVADSAKTLFPIGVYTPDARAVDANKVIGSIPDKLERSLRLLEAPENTTVDIIVDAGLSTIFATTEDSSVAYFDDTTYVSQVSALTDDWRTVANILVDFCQNVRKDCVAILDPLRSIFITGKDTKTLELDSANFTTNVYTPLKTLASFESSYSTMYGNWVKIPDVFTSRRMWLPFSAFAAAVYARSDAAANTWAAPAGLNRGSFLCLDIAFNPNQKQRDRLYEMSVNPVVFFNGDGFTVWGQRTLQTKPTAFDRINVRRLFLTLERAVQRTMKYFVFEPNTDFTRARVKNVISPLFEYAKNTEGVYDYLIVCDERNNTPDSIDRNELIIDIYLKPVRTAEFILVNFIATRTGQSFQELI